MALNPANQLNSLQANELMGLAQTKASCDDVVA
jgi:hypothetical protein